MTSNPVKVSPVLLQHIAFVQAQLRIHREACTTRPHDCQLRDGTLSGQFDPVCLTCTSCDTEIVLFKHEE